LAGHVTLMNGERSRVATLASKILWFFLPSIQ
jgi:predicted ribonuclease YlaK